MSEEESCDRSRRLTSKLRARNVTAELVQRNKEGCNSATGAELQNLSRSTFFRFVFARQQRARGSIPKTVLPLPLAKHALGTPR